MSLRTKQALILFIATLVPFILGGVAMNLAVAPAYRKVVSRAALSETQRLGEHAAWNVAREVDRVDKLAAWADIRQLLSTRADLKKAPPDPVTNAVSDELRWWRITDPGIAEVLLTDPAGKLAATGGAPPRSDFRRQGWWQGACRAGRGGLYVSDLVYLPGVRSWCVRIAVPVRAEATPGSRCIGVLEVAFEVRRLFQEIARADAGDSEQAYLVDPRGRILVSRSGIAPLSRTLPEPAWRLMRDPGQGSALSRNHEHLLAWAALPLQDPADLPNARLPRLFMVTSRRTDAVFAPLHVVQAWMIAIALLTIAAIVSVGSWLADALVVRHVRRLAAGMRKLAAGDFAQAAAIAEELTQHHRALERRVEPPHPCDVTSSGPPSPPRAEPPQPAPDHEGPANVHTGSRAGT